jgi:DNA-binding NarL/FixJ family response regulator
MQPGVPDRDCDLDIIESRLRLAQSGHGSLVLVTGVAGAGKTRLAEQAAALALARGLRVAWGRSADARAALPYSPWLVPVRGLMAALSRTEQQRLAAALPALATIVPVLRTRVPDLRLTRASPHVCRFQLFESVRVLLAQVALRVPLLLVLDDLHRADRSSVLLLESVAQSASQLRLVLLIAYRNPTRASPLRESIEQLVRLPHQKVVLETHARVRACDGMPVAAAAVMADRERRGPLHAEPVERAVLTPRERDVLALVAAGRTNKDIARMLAISINTVAVHVARILAKTGSANRTAASLYALRSGFVGEVLERA